jgi:hypothetical protein
MRRYRTCTLVQVRTVFSRKHSCQETSRITTIRHLADGREKYKRNGTKAVQHSTSYVIFPTRLAAS